LTYLARIKNLLAQYQEANKFLVQAESIASETEYNELLMSIYTQYAEMYTKTRNYEKAAIYQGRYISLRDSVYSQSLIKNLAKVQTNFEERENLKTIADKDVALALKEETLKRQRTENLFYGVVAVMVFVLAALMLLLFRLTRRANERLEYRVDVRTKELNDSNDALMKVNGEMDNFIYKTSHDIRGPGIPGSRRIDAHSGDGALGRMEGAGNQSVQSWRADWDAPHDSIREVYTNKNFHAGCTRCTIVIRSFSIAYLQVYSCRLPPGSGSILSEVANVSISV